MLPCVIANLQPEGALAQARLPDHAKTLIANGTLIWVRAEDEWIPYNAGSESAAFEKTLVATIEHNTELLSDFPILELLDYEGFFEGYFLGADLTGKTEYARVPGEIGVGHVAIIQSIDKQLYVLEAASPELGLLRTPLDDWLARMGQSTKFWLGRLNGFSDDEIQSIVSIAASQVRLQKPYGFFNFDLDDSSSFYCSKLIWYSVHKATGKRIDDGISYALPWYSPKQMLESRLIKIILSPDDY